MRNWMRRVREYQHADRSVIESAGGRLIRTIVDHPWKPRRKWRAA